MTKSKRQKGLEFQRWIANWLCERNWIVHNQTPAGRMIFIKGKKIFVSQRNDIFGCFDLIAKKNGETLWIQATCHKSMKEKAKQIEDAELTYGSQEFPMIFLKRESHIDIYGFDEIGQLVHPKEPILYGKIIRRKFYSSEGVKFEF